MIEKKISLFVVDDESSIRKLMRTVFGGDNFELDVFPSADEFLASSGHKEYDVGIIDIKMPGRSGMELLKILKGRDMLTEYIILTGQGTISNAIEAMKLGCYDFVTKPMRLEELKIIVQKAYERKMINRENMSLREELQLKDKFHGMVGKSASMKDVFSMIEKVSKTDSPVLITGESGTGKELAASAIQKSGARADRPFIVVDCASLSEHLLENELFGHEKGAYTDAISMKRGLFEVADTGTLFIDEIAEMSPETQSKLLRVLETFTFRRVGGNQQLKVDVRILAATNKDLKQEIGKGRFREDLYYRLNVFNIHLPPLRERKEDIPILAKHFIANSQVTCSRKRIRAEDINALMAYDWPGNVRELANAIERAMIVSSDDFITKKDFPIGIGSGAALIGDGKSLEELVRDYERETIEKTIKKCGNSKIKAAKMLGISRAQLYRKLGE